MLTVTYRIDMVEIQVFIVQFNFSTYFKFFIIKYQEKRIMHKFTLIYYIHRLPLNKEPFACGP